MRDPIRVENREYSIKIKMLEFYKSVDTGCLSYSQAVDCLCRRRPLIQCFELVSFDPLLVEVFSPASAQSLPQDYFPMQKLENIRPSKSSVVNCPVISPRD